MTYEPMIAPPAKPRRNLRIILIVAAIVLVLCCGGGIGGGAWLLLRNGFDLRFVVLKLDPQVGVAG